MWNCLIGQLLAMRTEEQTCLSMNLKRICVTNDSRNNTKCNI